RHGAVGNLRAVLPDNYATAASERNGRGAGPGAATVPAGYRWHRPSPQVRRPFDRACARPTRADVDAGAASRKRSSVVEEQRRWWISRGGRHSWIAHESETGARSRTHLKPADPC